ncbi:phage regulatory CII family protein [Neisseria shayeganii]|uniref:Phage regulatory CII family protein n=1 Tax=Neisseria shayeganii TaxID=607712 RepID=A0A7D7N8K6_9NEIS|nr:phage regulatory CII family protein [Neisseria shayeganii]QMT41261.1 phage regulatory CII family protein [Neisseria shayeganii]
MKTAHDFLHHPEFALLLQAACKNGRGGITAVAATIGMNEKLLANKLNPNCPTNHPTADEVCRIVEATQDIKPVQRLAGLAGYVCMPLPDCDRAYSDPLAGFADVAEKHSRVAKKLIAAHKEESESGREIGPNEQMRIRAAILDMVNDAMCLYGSI